MGLSIAALGGQQGETFRLQSLRQALRIADHRGRQLRTERLQLGQRDGECRQLVEVTCLQQAWESKPDHLVRDRRVVGQQQASDRTAHDLMRAHRDDVRAFPQRPLESAGRNQQAHMSGVIEQHGADPVGDGAHFADRIRKQDVAAAERNHLRLQPLRHLRQRSDIDLERIAAARNRFDHRARQTGRARSCCTRSCRRHPRPGSTAHPRVAGD